MADVEFGSEPTNADRREAPDNNIDDGNHPPPLGVELTGHRLLTTGVVLGLGIPMAVYSYNGQTLFSTRLDWVVRVICALLLSLLGLIKANRPELAPHFFQTDLSPYILGILRYISRSESLYMLLATGFMLRATMHLRGMLGGECYREHVCEIAANVIKFELILAELALGAAIYTICLICFLCLGVVWRGNSREYFGFLFSLVYSIWAVCSVYAANCKDLLDKGTHQPQSILIIAIRDVKWMHTVSLSIFFGWVFPDRNHEALPIENLILAAYVLAMEATFIGLVGFPDSRDALICTSISCCLVTVLLSHIPFITVFKPGDSLLTRIRKASTPKL